MTISAGPVVPLRRAGAGKLYSISARGNEADVYLYDLVGDSWDGTTAKQFAADLKEVKAASTLNIYINSPGGSVFDGVAIFNQLARHKARKVVIVDGIAASIASVIAMAGDEIRIAANGMMMIHNPWGVVAGESKDFRHMAEQLDKVRDTIINTYVNRTGVPADRVASLMDAETWFNADEAVKAGFADLIIDAVEVAALAKHDLSLFKNAPEIPTGEDHPQDQAAPGRPHPLVARVEARIAAMRAAKQRGAASSTQSRKD